jgi:hypothetical protein
MEDLEEGMHVEKDNVAIREAMLLYNTITDSEDKWGLMLRFMEAGTKVLVPVYEDEDDPDGLPEFGSMYKHEKGVELHVFTTVTLIPEEIDAPGVCFYTLWELLRDAAAAGEVDIIRMDPGTPHGVGFYFEAGVPNMFRLPRVEALLREEDDDTP